MVEFMGKQGDYLGVWALWQFTIRWATTSSGNRDTKIGNPRLHSL